MVNRPSVELSMTSVLSHHRAYRSVHGGSLVDANLSVVIRKEDIA
jgi:hypothetical protein